MSKRLDYLQHIEQLLLPENLNSFLIFVASNRDDFDKNINHIISYLMYKFKEKNELLSKLKVLTYNSEDKNMCANNAKYCDEISDSSDTSCNDDLYAMGTNKILEDIFYTVLKIKKFEYVGNVFTDSLELFEEDCALYKKLVLDFFRNANLEESNVDGMIDEVCTFVAELYNLKEMEQLKNVEKSFSKKKDQHYIEQDNLVKDGIEPGLDNNLETIKEGQEKKKTDSETEHVISNPFIVDGKDFIKNIDDEDPEVLKKLDISIQNQLKALKYEKEISSEKSKDLIGSKIYWLLEILIKARPIRTTRSMKNICKIEPVSKKFSKKKEGPTRTSKLYFKNLSICKPKKLLKDFLKNCNKYPECIVYLQYIHMHFEKNRTKFNWKKVFKMISLNEKIKLKGLDSNIIPSKVVYKAVVKAEKPKRFKKLLKSLIKTEYDTDLLYKYKSKYEKSLDLKLPFSAIITKMEKRISEISHPEKD